MPNRKQQYQAAAREMVKQGLVNNADGRWVRPSSQGDFMFRSQVFGYKLGHHLGLPVSRPKG